jgi:hypothetical protein
MTRAKNEWPIFTRFSVVSFGLANNHPIERSQSRNVLA